MRLPVSLCALALSTSVYAAPIAKSTNDNPASVGYVNKLIAALKVSRTFKVGDTYQGGTIFYVDSTGRHGLMLPTAFAQGTKNSTGGFSEGISTGGQAAGDSIGAGYANTMLWNAMQVAASPTSPVDIYAPGHTNEQAYTADNERCGATFTESPVTGNVPNPLVKCYGGYYLPSLTELELAYNSGVLQNKYCGVDPNAPPITDYWTSTSYVATTLPSNDVYTIDFATGAISTALIQGDPSGMRCILPIRAF